MSKTNLEDAIDLCRAFGYEVIDKERIKKLSFTSILTDEEMENIFDKEFLEKHYEERAFRTLYDELKQTKSIKKKTSRENLFLQNATRTTWWINILE